MADVPLRVYKSDEEKVKVYEHRLRLAEEENKKWHPLVQSFWNRYEGKARAEAMSQSGHNVSGSTPMYIGIIDSLYSSMTAVEVDLSVTPKGKATDDQAYLAQGALSQEWLECDVNENGNEAVKDGLVGGIGFAKVGYEYAETVEQVPRSDQDIRAEVSRLITEAEGVEGAPNALEIMGQVPLTEERTTILLDRIVVDYVPWDMILWDPTVKRWGDIHWVAQKTLMTVREVQENPLFQEYVASRRQGKALKDLKADTTIERGILGEFADPTKEDERVTVYTVYDFETGTVCTYAKGSKFLLNETANPFAMMPDIEDKSPFVPLVLRHTSSRIRGVSETEALLHTLQEKDLYHSRLATYLERAAPKLIAKSRAFTAAGKDAMRSQEIGAVVELEEGFDPMTDVHELTAPALLSEMFGMPEKLEQQGRDAVGVSELMRGLFPDRKRTATETSEVVSASAARQSEKRTVLENFWLAIAHRMLALMQMFYEQARVARLADDLGDVPWAWTNEDIVGEFDLDISLTPKEPKSWQTRRDNALATLNVVGPLAQPGPDGSSPVNITEMLRYVLTEMHIPRRVIHSILNLPEDQQQQVMANLQTTAAQAQAQQGMTPNPASVPGPLNAQALAAATNTGEIPADIIAAAQGGSPIAPQAAEQVSESRGLALPTG